MKPPPGVHWVEIYDEMADDPEFDPNWIFDLLHPDDCAEEIATQGVCEAHKPEGAPQTRFASSKDADHAFRMMSGWCEDCAVAGPKMSVNRCGFQYEVEGIGDDAYLPGPTWADIKGTHYFHERHDLVEGVYRVTYEHDGHGENYCGWIEVHEAVEAKL